METKPAFRLFAALILLVAAVTAAVLARSGLTAANEGATAANAGVTTGSPAMVRVRVITHEGQLSEPVEMAKIQLSDEEWRQRLTPEQFAIVRAKGTERPYCGTLLDNKMEGVYACVACGLPLFSSDAKFTSGTGWPSFFKPVAEENIHEESDTSYGMVRTEILCARCDGHLGHVFEDGPRPTGLRYCVNSESLRFVASEDIKELGEELPAATSEMSMKKKNDPFADILPAPALNEPRAAQPGEAAAVFAGGCFWCTEAVFERLEGVKDVVSGYCGGSAETADYKTVCTGTTGHAEAIRIIYDPSVITYGELLRVFFATHDPTTLNRQGPDSGTQYRSAVFYANDEQKRIAEAYLKQLTEAKAFDKPIVTTLEALTQFHEAEDYHQDFAANNPNYPYIKAWAKPKVDKLEKYFGPLLAEKSAAKK